MDKQRTWWAAKWVLSVGAFSVRCYPKRSEKPDMRSYEIETEVVIIPVEEYRAVHTEQDELKEEIALWKNLYFCEMDRVNASIGHVLVVEEILYQTELHLGASDDHAAEWKHHCLRSDVKIKQLEDDIRELKQGEENKHG